MSPEMQLVRVRPLLFLTVVLLVELVLVIMAPFIRLVAEAQLALLPIMIIRVPPVQVPAAVAPRTTLLARATLP